jgi:hypothetical protein
MNIEEADPLKAPNRCRALDPACWADGRIAQIDFKSRDA